MMRIVTVQSHREWYHQKSNPIFVDNLADFDHLDDDHSGNGVHILYHPTTSEMPSDHLCVELAPILHPHLRIPIGPRHVANPLVTNVVVIHQSLIVDVQGLLGSAKPSARLVDDYIHPRRDELRTKSTACSFLYHFHDWHRTIPKDRPRARTTVDVPTALSNIANSNAIRPPRLMPNHGTHEVSPLQVGMLSLLEKTGFALGFVLHLDL
mmetsp:Transcript_8797/g.22130  ORF Transcript_8797/g.22130 Transcript_8797/m.22130 type:complete len:209 (-) Transcript_8797:536-1162(-)